MVEKIFRVQKYIEKETNQALGQIVQKLTVHVKVDVAAMESKVSRNFHDVPFPFRWLGILQVFYSFCNGLDSIGRYDKKSVLSGAALRAAIRRRV